MRTLPFCVALIGCNPTQRCGAGNGSTPASNTLNVQARLAHGAVRLQRSREYLYPQLRIDKFSAYAIRATGTVRW